MPKNNILLHVRYPYTAGIIVIIWLGTAILAMFDRDSSLSTMLTANVIATTVIASIGFSDPRK